jgi:hypothetical protein
MRTTIRLSDALLDQARQEARRRGETLTKFIEESLRRELIRSQKAEPRKKVKLPVLRGAELMPGVDINDSAGLLAVLEEGLPINKLR